MSYIEMRTNTQEQMSEIEPEWNELVERLVASPQQPTAAPRTTLVLRPSASTFEQQGPSLESQSAEGKMGGSVDRHSHHVVSRPLQPATTPTAGPGPLSDGRWRYNSSLGAVAPTSPLVEYIRRGHLALPGDSEAGLGAASPGADSRGGAQRGPRAGRGRTRGGPQQAGGYDRSAQLQRPQTPPWSKAAGPATDRTQTTGIDPSAHMFESVQLDPAWLSQALRDKQHPSFNQAVMDMPFMDPTDGLQVPKHGVIRFANPPYYVTRAEVLATLGRFADVIQQPAGTPYRAVHILMERTTGKTKDIFVEVKSSHEARAIADNFARRAAENRSVTLGSARAELHLSDGDHLMRELFPNARRTIWRGYKATVDWNEEYYFDGDKALGFDGFLGAEDSALLCKWLEGPARSPFIQQCLVRPYENAITILHRYPIDNPDNILMVDRFRLYKIADTAIRQLCEVLHSPRCPGDITRNLLKEVVIAAFSQVIFSDGQRYALFSRLKHAGFDYMVTDPGVALRDVNLHEFAGRWPFLAYQRRAKVSDKLVRYFASLIREYNERNPPDSFTANELAAMAQLQKSLQYNEPFVGVRVPYAGKSEEAIGRMSWRQTSAAERQYICEILMVMIGGYEA